MAQESLVMMATQHVGLGVLVLSIIMVILTGLAVLLRFIVRAMSKASFGADDWWALVSVGCFYVATSANIWCTEDWVPKPVI